MLAPPSLVPGKGATVDQMGVEIVGRPPLADRAGYRRGNGAEDRHSGDEPEAEPELIAAALAVIPDSDL